MKTPTLILAALLAGASALSAAPITILNYSFESPVAPDPSVSPVGFFIDNWQRNDNPPNPSQTFFGTYHNPAVNSPNNDHINNLDGDQGAFIIDIPGVALWQTLSTNVQLGEQYRFTLALSADHSATLDGEGMRIRIYYLDTGSNKVYLGDRLVLSNETRALNPDKINTLLDYSVTTSVIAAGNAAIGRPIGVEIAGDVTSAGGYWDFDNARMDTVPEPSTAALLLLAGVSLLGRRRRK